MRIDNLCKQIPRCEYCPLQTICSYNIGELSDPLSDITEEYAEKITNGIITTAKILTEVNHD